MYSPIRNCSGLSGKSTTGGGGVVVRVHGRHRVSSWKYWWKVRLCKFSIKREHIFVSTGINICAIDDDSTVDCVQNYSHPSDLPGPTTPWNMHTHAQSTHLYVCVCLYILVYGMCIHMYGCVCMYIRVYGMCIPVRLYARIDCAHPCLLWRSCCRSSIVSKNARHKACLGFRVKRCRV